MGARCEVLQRCIIVIAKLIHPTTTTLYPVSVCTFERWPFAVGQVLVTTVASWLWVLHTRTHHVLLLLIIVVNCDAFVVHGESVSHKVQHVNSFCGH